MSNINNENNLVMPTLALRGLVAFPSVSMHFDVAREMSKKALEFGMKLTKEVFLVTQKNILTELPNKEDLYSVGTICEIKQLLKLDNGVVRVFVEGKEKAKLVNLVETKPYLLSEVKPQKMMKIKFEDKKEEIAVMRLTKSIFQKYFEKLPNPSAAVMESIMTKEAPYDLFNAILPNMLVDESEKQKLLEINKLDKALETMLLMLQNEASLLDVEQQLFEKVHYKMDKNQRDYFLREQMNVIREELGEEDNEVSTTEFYMETINSIINIDEDSRARLQKECVRYGKLPEMSQEANIIRTYLEAVLELPFDSYTSENLNIKNVQKVLDKDHYGLKEVKDKILDILAVRAIKPDVKGQIICLVGPPGVGKTSVASSVAKALNRRYARVSLGGVSDEAEIRGHRKTYLGAMPGKIIKAFISAKTNNPLILLDEIDKLGRDYKGDPASALLEVLDPEQNKAFVDNYVEIPFDLSKALFITTANTLDTIPGPLLDRMEIIELKSYTREEKFNIAKKHLLPKQLERNGVKKLGLAIRDSAIYEIIDCYTREAGVRKLEKEITTICRKAAKAIVSGEVKKQIVTDKNIEDYLGVRKLPKIRKNEQSRIGVVNGLAWTSVGGEMLEIEAIALKGSGKIKITGNLGDVMKESAEIAVSYVRSIANKYSINENFYKEMDIHIHAPEGAVPKDGPSAGVTITTALVSALSKTAVRGDVAMTGEISLTGRVMQIGGLREKSIAAYREGKTTIIIPKDNLPDTKEFDRAILDNITFVPVERVEEVLDVALLKPISSDKKQGITYEWTGETETTPVTKPQVRI